MKRHKAMPESLQPLAVKNLWARQYLIETFSADGRCDINGLALALGISVENVRHQFADLLEFLEEKEFSISPSDI